MKKQEAPHAIQNGHYSQHGAHAMMASGVKMDSAHVQMTHVCENGPFITMCADFLRVLGQAVKKQEGPHAIPNGHCNQPNAHATMAPGMKMDPAHVNMNPGHVKMDPADVEMDPGESSNGPWRGPSPGKCPLESVKEERATFCLSRLLSACLQLWCLVWAPAFCCAVRL